MTKKRPTKEVFRGAYDDIHYERYTDHLNKHIDHLEEQNKKQIELLKIASCPYCDGSGVIPHLTIKTGFRQISDTEQEPYPIEEFEAEPCQWCDEKNTLTQNP